MLRPRRRHLVQATKERSDDASSTQAYRRRRPMGWAVAAALVFDAAASVAIAQEAGPGELSGSASISGITQLRTSLDGGGSFSWGGGMVRGGLTSQLTAAFSAGLSLRYGYESWHFATPSALGATAPWGNINRPGVEINLRYRAAPDVALFVAPQIEWNYETGASAGSAQNYGAVIGATKVFSPTLVLGLGAGVFRQIDKTTVFPFVIVNWQINDKWRLSNPFQASPAGGAGLELVYSLGPDWELAGGGTYREYRFRLRGDGPIPDGIGRNQGIPLFARLTRMLGPQGRLDFYAGAVAGGQLRVLDGNGATVASSDYKLSPLLGVTAALNF